MERTSALIKEGRGSSLMSLLISVGSYYSLCSLTLRSNWLGKCMNQIRRGDTWIPNRICMYLFSARKVVCHQGELTLILSLHSHWWSLNFQEKAILSLSWSTEVTRSWGHGSLVKHLPRTDVTAQNYDALYYWIVDGAWASQISPKASHLARKEFSIEPPKNTDPESHLWMFILRMFGEESLRVW
jgi:hypothetical protein